MSVFKLRQLLVGDETSGFAAYAESGSPTFGTSLPINDATVTLTQERTPDAAAQARLAERAPGHLNVRSAKLEFTTYIPGNLQAPGSGIQSTWFADLLTDALGTSTSSTSTTVGSSVSSSNFWVASASGWAAGIIGRAGDRTNGNGSGQAFVVGAVSGTSITTLTALPATPANSSDIHACGVIHRSEGLAHTYKHFLAMHSSTGAQYYLGGAQLSGLKLNIPTGPNALPTATWTFDCAAWRALATSFPDSTARAENDCAPVAGGSLFIANVGTTTRTTLDAAEMSLDLNMPLQPIYGSVGANGGTYQNIIGWARTGFDADLTVKIPWESTYETWFDTSNLSLVYKHILFTANPTAGCSWGFYMPRVMPAGNSPSMPINVNEQNYVEVKFAAREGATTTNELTRSSWRFFYG